MKRLTIGAWFATIVWFTAIVTLSWRNPQAFDRMPANAWGDFLAGLSAPVALFWLVVGYYQQGEELKQNTEALKLQATELHTSADATVKLVEAALAQARASEKLASIESDKFRQRVMEAIAQLRPRFICASANPVSAGSIDLPFQNHGGAARDLRIEAKLEGVRATISPVENIDNLQKGRISFRCDPSMEGEREKRLPRQFPFTITCVDQSLRRWEIHYEYLGLDGFTEVVHPKSEA